MKKYILFIAGVVLAGGFLSSCSLNEDPKDQIPEGDAYQSPTLIYLNTVASLYTEVGGTGGGQGLGGTDRGIYDLNTYTSDEMMLPTRGGDWDDGGLWRDLFQHKWSIDNDVIKGSWDYLYRVIGKTNMSIDKLNSLIEGDPENKDLPIYLAELRTYRAMYYSYLLDLFGNVPLVIKGSQEIKDVKQSSRSVLFDFVVKELQESVPLLSDANSTNTGRYYGRMTKPVAYYLLAKLALNTQVYADDNWADGKADGDYSFSIEGQTMNPWEATIYYADKITELGYVLEDDFKANFAVNNEQSRENIFVIPMDPTTFSARMMYSIRSWHYEHAKAYGLDGWNGASATKEAINIFRKGKEDPRMMMTWYTGKVFDANGNPVMNGDEQLEYFPDDIALILSGTPHEKTAGARWAKYQIDPTAQSGGQLIRNDYVLFRYADILLMKAEALVRNGGVGDTELNMVRARVGAPNRVATLQNILDERMLELAGEGVRRTDLIRFGQYTKAISDRPASEATRTVFPIPAEVINLNPDNLTQNPGY
ncbi:RagB/SusD family nutrient uptake outer membrane protein [Porphyromonadaceae bacterium W3.11]|nr:RagB/SusD family nutrient uptake outer membrane protein [Porphyromonadaceae bacterium W3.11]